MQETKINNKITLAILTWKAPKTLQASLESIEQLLPIFNEKILICQESDPREIIIGKQFGFDTIALKDNIGIQNGMKCCFESSKNELVLFYENDLNLRTTTQEAKEVIQEAATAIEREEVAFAKLRYLYGNTSLKSKNFEAYWKIKEGILKKRILSYFRPNKAAAVLSTSIPHLHSQGITPTGYEKFSENFLLGSSVSNKWENLAVMTTKTFFSGLINFAESNPTSRSINGSPDLEHPLNCRKNRSWYKSLDAKVLIAIPGLFGHRRYDRTENDEKWDMVDPKDEGGCVDIS